LLYKYYPIEQFKKAEVYCLKILEYKLNHFNFFHFSLFFMTYSCVYTNTKQTIDNIDHIEFFNKLCKFSENILLNPNFIGNEPWKLSCAVVAYVRESFSLSKWNDKLKTDFKMSFDDFIEEYKTIKR
jgi:hypothetical protein